MILEDMSCDQLQLLALLMFIVFALLANLLREQRVEERRVVQRVAERRPALLSLGESCELEMRLHGGQVWKGDAVLHSAEIYCGADGQMCANASMRLIPRYDHSSTMSVD